MARAILYDSTLCVGCRACEDGCARKWGLPYNDEIGKDERLSERKLTTVTTHGERYARRLCMHCTDPTCVSVCPVGAFSKTPLGPVVYDEDRCMGCRYCMLACPFQVPVYEWTSRAPRVKKCDMCHQRQSAGQPTVCSEACPTGAAITGERDALLAEAIRRIAEKSKQYHNRIYGRRDAGGTSVLMLAAVPFDQLGFRTDLDSKSYPELTKGFLYAVPAVLTLWPVFLVGLSKALDRQPPGAAGDTGKEG